MGRLDALFRDLGELRESHREARSLFEFSRYAGDPVCFCSDILSVTLYTKQVEIAEAVRDYPLVTVKGCNASGKDYATAALALWWALARRGLVILTGPTERQVKTIIMGHVATMWSRQRDLPGELYASALRLEEGGILCFTSTEASRLTGFHDARVLAVLTEAQAVPEFAYEAMLANAIGEDDRVLLLGNPVVTSGRFYQTHRESRWHPVTISALDIANVKEGRTVIPGLMTRAGVARIRAEWGESSGVFRARCLGEFPTQSEEGLFNLEHIEVAQQHHKSWLVGHAKDRPVVAVDPARYGSDATAVAVMRGPVLVRLSCWSKASLTDTAKRVELILREEEIQSDHGHRQRGSIVVDGVGLGGGVCDILREKDYWVTEFNAGARASDSDRFANTRSECFWKLRDQLERGEIALPADKELVEDLMSVNWYVTPDGRVALERKEDLRSRLGRSPDRADALVMALACDLFSRAQGDYGITVGSFG